MRVFDVNKFAASGSGFMGSKIIITYETGEQEILELQAYTEKTEPENLKVIAAALNKLKEKGYMLMSANSTGDQGNIVTDYVLLKQVF
jgi:3-hydroxyacyl-CoA dehydrogenase